LRKILPQRGGDFSQNSLDLARGVKNAELTLPVGRQEGEVVKGI
jgi:hypothetical protein